MSSTLQIDLLEEMSQAPRILSDVDAVLKAKQMKADVDEYLRVIIFDPYQIDQLVLNYLIILIAISQTNCRQGNNRLHFSVN